MKAPGWFKRGAATAAAYLFTAMLVAGGVLSLMMTAADVLGATQPLQSGLPSWLVGLLGGIILSAGPALAAALGLTFVSTRIHSGWAWIGWSVLVYALLAVGLVAVITSSMTPEDGIGLKLFLIAVLSVPHLFASLGAGIATIRVRPRQRPASAAEVFS